MVTSMMIGAYFFIRVCFQLHIRETPASEHETRKRIIGLGVIGLPIVTIQYAFHVAEYVPCTLCVPPIGVEFFVGWLSFLVADCLYQFWMLSENIGNEMSEN